jgi:hypothetical protein
MTSDNTLFIGTTSAYPTSLPLAEILHHFDMLRDAAAGTLHVESHDLVTLVANTSFIYAFNAYKAISLLLPDLYHESAAAVLRQLWEVSLNLHWVGVDPETRSRAFCSFTVMEFRKFLQKSSESASLKSLDESTERFQSTFRYQDRNGRNRIHGNFAAANIYERAEELGDPWESEYKRVYHLTSMHAHGAPGAVLHAMFQQQYGEVETREKNAASLIAILAMGVMVRNIELLVRLKIVSDASGVLGVYEALKKNLASGDGQGNM